MTKAPLRTGQLAKLSRPRLVGITPRERLFARLDEFSEHPVVWIAGPPGAGKTSLATSYLTARKRRAVWYQIDSGDTDVATLFLFLRELAPRSGRRSLPALAPEYLANLAGYSRRFFRRLYASLAGVDVLVLDNFQEAEESAEFQAVMREALAEIPSSLQVMVLSRAAPPAAMARLLASNSIGLLGWEDLRLTQDEVGAVAGSDTPHQAARIAALHERTGGWAAGVTLILEYWRRGNEGALAPGGIDETHEAVFNYFAGEIFAALPGPTRLFLLRTAFLPHMTVAMAKAIGDEPAAGKLLEWLYRRHLFIDRRNEREPWYQYHALYRSFLGAQARATFGAEDMARLSRHAAQLLEASGDAEEALKRYLDGGDRNSAARLVERLAKPLLAQGRRETLRRWIESLPSESDDRSARLLYWLGTAQSRFDFPPQEARRTLELAFNRFSATGDILGEVEAATRILETYVFERTHLELADPWVTLLQQRVDKHGGELSPEVEFRALANLLAIMTYRQPCSAELPEYARRLLAMMDLAIAADEKVDAAYSLLAYYRWMGDLDRASRVQHRVEPLLEREAISPMNRIWWWLMRGRLVAQLTADNEQAERLYQQALAITQAEEMRFLNETIIRLYQAHLTLNRGDVKAATPLLTELELALNPDWHLDFVIFCWLKSWCAALQGNLALAQKHAQEAVMTAQNLGAPTSHGFSLLAVAQIAGQRGQQETARGALSEARAELAGMQSRFFAFNAWLVDADLSLSGGQPERGIESLRAAFRLGAERGYLNTFLWLPTMMARLAAAALAHDIEPDYARQIIAARALPAPSPDVEVWPWPVRIYALGRFDLVVSNVPLRFAAKAQKKPLELVKTLIALGGREVAASRLAAVLWPEVVGETAQKSLETTVSRLRKLLGSDAAILVHDNKLTLNVSLCWVDVWAFERAATALYGALSAGRDELEPLAARLLHLYQGSFLGREEEAAWLLPMRERLKSRFTHALSALGARLEAAGNWQGAASLYRRGLEADSLAEALYRGLIRCHREQGDIAAALEAYRRCRQMLSVILGVKPSAETEALCRTLSRT